jgi:RNA polymerase sigma-70 factor (sigma-E family)
MDQAAADAFDDLVTSSGGRLLRTCYLLTGDRGLAEDLLQTALTTTYLRWDRIRDRGAGEAYVRVVAAHTAARWWRRKWRGEVPTEPLPDTTATGDAYAAADERPALRRALLSLPPGQRAVVVLRFFDDLGETDVAAALGVSVGTVKSRTSRALARLRTDPSVAALLDGPVAERSAP